MNVVRIVTYNLMDYGDPDNPDPQRWALGEDVLAETEFDICAVKEVMGAQAGATFTHLVDQVGWRMFGHGGLSCLVPGRGFELSTAFQPGRRGRGVGLMWRADRVRPVPESLRLYNMDPLYTGMVSVDFIVDGVRVTVATTHLAPRLPDRRYEEILYVATELAKRGRHAIACADWNQVFASRTAHGQYYDPDPYEQLDWRPTYAGMARRNPVTGTGVARREAMEELEDWGLFDPAARIGAQWYATVGHWGQDAVTMRVDGPLVTRDVADATVSIFSVNNKKTRKASDHWPVVHVVDLGKLRAA